MPGITVEVTGLRRFGRFMAALGEKALPTVGEGLYMEASIAMTASQRVVPVGGPPTSPYDRHPGNLKSTGRVELPTMEGDAVVVRLHYGDTATPYAAVQHERDDYRHKPGQQAHYLSEPVLARIPGLGERLGAFLRRAAHEADTDAGPNE